MTAGPVDVWGGLTVPLQPALDADVAAGDPAITALLDFLKAFVVTDGNGVAAWTQVGVAPGVPPIRSVHAHNPSDTAGDRHGVGFNTKDLPALYAWRADPQSTLEYIADDVLVDTSTVKMLWVFPDTVQAIQRKRQPYANALAKCVVTAIERGLTPSYQIPGDTEPSAPLYGSMVYTAMNCMALNVTSWRPARVEVEGQTHPYAAIEFTIELKENQELSSVQSTDPAAVTITITEGTDVVGIARG